MWNIFLNRTVGEGQIRDVQDPKASSYSHCSATGQYIRYNHNYCRGGPSYPIKWNSQILLGNLGGFQFIWVPQQNKFVISGILQCLCTIGRYRGKYQNPYEYGWCWPRLFRQGLDVGSHRGCAVQWNCAGFGQDNLHGILQERYGHEGHFQGLMVSIPHMIRGSCVYG